MTTYVVWLKPTEGQPVNLGTLNVDRNLRGTFKTRTPFKQFEVFVTAEKMPSVVEPSNKRIMRASVAPTMRATF
jgi:hypothetical protein